MVVAPPLLVFCRNHARDKSWNICANDQRVGLLSLSRPAEKNRVFPLGRFGTGRFLVSLLEHGEGDPYGLELAVLVRLPNRRKVVVDATGKNLGDWQGEWMRILGHPAGRIMVSKASQWDWVGPTGGILANWTRFPDGKVELQYSGLEADQAYCRIVAAIWTWEIIQKIG